MINSPICWISAGVAMRQGLALVPSPPLKRTDSGLMACMSDMRPRTILQSVSVVRLLMGALLVSYKTQVKPFAKAPAGTTK